MSIDKEMLDSINNKKLNIVSRLAKRTISKVVFNSSDELISKNIDNEKFDYLINKGIEKQLRGLGC
mgnify:CR=1 FL=1